MIEKAVIVTGGSGFIGTHLVQHLLAHNLTEKIYIFDIKPPIVNDPRITYLECDLRKPITLTLPEAVTTCFHLAAVAKEPGFEWDEYYQTNYQGTKHLCDWLEQHNINNLIFTSTMMVFKAGDKRYSETDTMNADTGYGGSKALAEEVSHAWKAKNPDRRLRIVRPGVVFGKGENGNYTRLYYALKKKRFFYIGRKSTIKSSIYVKDLVRLLALLLNDSFPHDVYHAVYPQPTSIETIYTTMAQAFQIQSNAAVIPYSIALGAAYGFETLNTLGLKNPIHHRRVQKLYYSTNLSAQRLEDIGFQFRYPLLPALQDWSKDCQPHDLF